jgi:hypothetical protein
MALGTGITGYPAMAADEGNYLEQAWALNYDALAHCTSWYNRAPLGWIELWLMANLVGAVATNASACPGDRLRSGPYSGPRRRPP